MSCDNCSSCNSFSCETEDVREFVPGKEYVVGEFFKYGNCTYKVVESGCNHNCPLCDLKLCDEFVCTCYERSDSNVVEAILYDSEE